MNKAVGHDQIPPYFQRIAAVIAPYLQFFFELSFIEGILPENYTIAKVTLLHKKGDKTNPTNYQLISILSYFSRIFERLIYSRFTKLFSKHKVIYEAQYECQKNISLVHVVLYKVSSTFRIINENYFTRLTLLELQKAFDTVPYDILPAKLEHYDIRGPD